MEWKTLAFYRFDIIWFNNLSWSIFDSDLAAIKVSDNKLNASQCLKKSNFLFNQQISTLSFEFLMRLLLHYNNNVSWLNTWIFISFTMESIFGFIRATFINLSIQNLFLFDNFFAITNWTLIFLINYFSSSTTIITRSL